MKLKLKKNEKIGHTEMVCGVCWAPNNQLYSLGDDKIIYSWDTNGELVSKFVDLDTYCTAIEWGPYLKSGNDILAIGSSDGALKLLNKSGKTEVNVETAHNTAVKIIKILKLKIIKIKK
jgi:WD40 repeat protein